MLIEHASNYIQLRQIGGFKFKEQAKMVRSFVRFACECGDSHIRTDTVIEWAAQGTSANQRETRLRTIIAFARHCRAENTVHELPPSHVFSSGRHKRPVAYTFSPEEINRIMSAALELEPKASLRPMTYYTLFGLLAATGLRSGEGIGLRLDDITPDGLLIRESKFRKSRLIPVHSSTSEALDQYINLRKQMGISSDQIFVGLKGQPLEQAGAQQAFRTVIQSIGLGAARYGYCPRLHDLRHTWAVRALESGPSDVEQMDRHSRAVMTYLGHSSVAASYYYMHSTPKLMNIIADACATLEQEDKS
jgi:integrase